MSRSVTALWARIAGLLGLGLLLAILQNWALWGYFVSRPTLAGDLADSDTLIAFSMLKFKPGPMVLSLAERTAAVTSAAYFCEEELNECREGYLILRLQRVYGGIPNTADVGESSLQAAWAALTRDGWLPTVSGPEYRETGVPVAGLAILFRKPSNQEQLLLAYRTSEIANDRYAYSEALFRMTASGPTLVKQVHFFLDIAGMEGLGWPILWPVNVILLLALWVAVSAAKWLRREVWAG